MAEHSNTVGGSTAGRIIACPASYRLCKELPARPSSPDAERGTALHSAMEYLLTHDAAPIAVLDMEFDDRKISQEDCDDALTPALKMVNEFIDKCEESEDYFEFHLEQRVQFPVIPNSFGTSDLIFKTAKRSGVIDYKFGYWAVLPDSEQNHYYARAGVHSFPKMFNQYEGAPPDLDWPVELMICQPAVSDELARHSTTVGSLFEFENELRDSFAEANTENPYMEVGAHCQFAPCKVICPFHTDAIPQLQKLQELEGAPYDKNTASMRTVSFEEKLGIMMDVVNIVEPWCKAARKLAHDHLEGGGAVPGMKLVPKRGTRQWADEIKALSLMQRNGFSVNERSPRKTASPAQAEKVFKKKGKAVPKTFKKYFDSVSSGNTMARSDDPRPAITSLAGAVEKFTAKMKQVKETENESSS